MAQAVSIHITSSRNFLSFHDGAAAASIAPVQPVGDLDAKYELLMSTLHRIELDAMFPASAETCMLRALQRRLEREIDDIEENAADEVEA